MPVTFDNFFGTAIAATASASFAMTLTTNATLIVGVALKGAALSLSTCAYNGVALTQLGRFQNGTPESIQIFGLTAPAAGANTLKITVVGGATPAVTLCALSYANVKAVNPWGTVVGGTAVAATADLSYSSSSTDMLVGFFEANQLLNMNNVGATVRFSNGAAMGYLAVDMAGLASITLSATATSGTGTWSFIGVSLAFSAPASTQRYFRALMGAGY